MSAVINEISISPLNQLPTFNPTLTLGLNSLDLFFNTLKAGANDTAANRYVVAISGLTGFIEEVIQVISETDNYLMGTDVVIEYRAMREKVHTDITDMNVLMAEHLSDTTYVDLCDANKRYLQAVDALSKFDQDDDWDIQMYHDAEDGAFDDLADAALAEFKNKKCQPL